MTKFSGVQEFKVKEDYIEVKLIKGETIIGMKINLFEHPKLHVDADKLARAIMDVAVKVLEA